LEFIRQEPNRCGSAALSEVLSYWGAPRAAEPELAAEVHSDSLRGTLNVDLVTAARRRELVTRDGASSMTELRSMLAAGYPALVMVNVGPHLLGRRHFLAVKGVDLERGYLMADDGRREDLVLRPRPFRRDWRASKFWALYCWPPEKMPAEVSAEEHLRAGVIFEGRGRPNRAARAYHRALRSSPQLWEAAFNLGNLALARRVLPAAERHYRAALKLRAREPDVLNNLAYVLLLGGDRLVEAEALARRAVAESGELTSARVRARHTLGVVLAARGKRAEARRALGLAVSEAKKTGAAGLAAAAQADLEKLRDDG
jgi:tetratricopeptide (TPR) repeat protein